MSSRAARPSPRQRAAGFTSAGTPEERVSRIWTISISSSSATTAEKAGHPRCLSSRRAEKTTSTRLISSCSPPRTDACSSSGFRTTRIPPEPGKRTLQVHISRPMSRWTGRFSTTSGTRCGSRYVMIPTPINRCSPSRAASAPASCAASRSSPRPAGGCASTTTRCPTGTATRYPTITEKPS